MRDKIERQIFFVGSPLYIPPKEITLSKSDLFKLEMELLEAGMSLQLNNYIYPASNTKIISE